VTTDFRRRTVEFMGTPPEPPVDPRFLLANERTLLAWLRTALTFVATGLALIALRHVGVREDWLLVGAVVSAVVGLATALWAYRHWRDVDRAIRASTPLPPPSLGPLLVLGIVVIAATGIVAVGLRL
jgi:putative membrane protein